VPSNIAEGQGRLNLGEFRQFLGIARGSSCELQTQLEIASDLGFGNAELIKEAEDLSHEVGKMIYAFLESLKD
jgi:four helix bundle protein